MKAVVVYYSKNGSTKKIAEMVAQKTGADLIEIRSKSAMPFPFQRRPRLLNDGFDLSAYDTVVLGTPVWAGNFASPIRSFAEAAKPTGKRVFLYACLAGAGSQRCFDNLKKLLEPGGNIVSEGVAFSQVGAAAPADLEAKVDAIAGEVQG